MPVLRVPQKVESWLECCFLSWLVFPLGSSSSLLYLARNDQVSLRLLYNAGLPGNPSWWSKTQTMQLCHEPLFGQRVSTTLLMGICMDVSEAVQK